MIPALINHLWQSTLFAGVAALLALSLRRNHAHARHRLWLAASVKFLVPFSLLISLGGQISWRPAHLTAQPGFSLMMEQISEPATVAALPSAHKSGASVTPNVLFALWLCGFVAVTFRWGLGWRKIRRAVRTATPLHLEIDHPIDVKSSATLLEPGVFGIRKPVLLLPEGITERLSSAHLEAIVAHELCHVRRRDNLAAAIHMVVEALFWFHPLIWWLGARLVEERERACDEEVLRLGNAPGTYAESILKTCQFYLESPLVCVSGVTGADLKKRIEAIMTERVAHNLDFGKKLLLSAMAVAAVAGPIAIGLMNAPPIRAQQPDGPRPSFEVASIKPGDPNNQMFRMIIGPSRTFSAANASLKLLITYAYDVREHQISGGPNWLDSAKFTVEAKPESSANITPGPDGSSPLRLMVQSLLAERFKLALHRETKEEPVYELVVAKGGSKLKEAVDTGDKKGPQGLRMGRGQLIGTAAPLALLVTTLSRSLGRSVVDKTGLAGKYDFKLEWTPDDGEPRGPVGGPDAPPPPDPNGPSIFTAVQEQLGLRLESRKGSVEILVIDHAEKASEN